MADWVKRADILAESYKQNMGCKYDNTDDDVFELRAALKLLTMSNGREYREKAAKLIIELDADKLQSALVDFVTEQMYFAGCWKEGIET